MSQEEIDTEYLDKLPLSERIKLLALETAIISIQTSVSVVDRVSSLVSTVLGSEQETVNLSVELSPLKIEDDWVLIEEE